MNKRCTARPVLAVAVIGIAVSVGYQLGRTLQHSARCKPPPPPGDGGAHNIQVARPVSQSSVLVAKGYATNSVTHGPAWERTQGIGRFAMDAENHRVLATIPGAAVLLLQDAVYVFNGNTPSSLGSSCRKYMHGAVRPTKLIHPMLSFLDQYMCAWVNPSPCSWSSVLRFYAGLRHTARVQQGSAMIDVYWSHFNITTQLPFRASVEKTVELQYDSTGVMTHLSHWTSDQSKPPFLSNADITHSDDDAVNISTSFDDSIFEPDATWNCTVIP
jgi:hypothetical protein